ncbi:MAG: hypothetical protein WD669_12925 [Pirellulales bacterium]
MRLNAAGEQLPGSESDRYLHYVKVKPGRFSVSAALEFGSASTYDYDKRIAHELKYAAKGEWTGQLQTGVAAVTLFEDAGK